MPNSTDKARHYFYQNDRISAVSDDDIIYTIFRSENLPLATIQCDSDSDLLMVEDKHSVLSGTLKKSARGYSAYGHKPDSDTKSDLLGFNGELRLDARRYSLGNGYRAYDPALMRFHAPDSESPFESGGVNAYAYCLGDPVNLADPSGHAPRGVLLRPPEHQLPTFTRSTPSSTNVASPPRSKIPSVAFAQSLHEILGKPSQRANQPSPSRRTPSPGAFQPPPRHSEPAHLRVATNTATSSRPQTSKFFTGSVANSRVPNSKNSPQAASFVTPAQALDSRVGNVSGYSQWSNLFPSSNSGMWSPNMAFVLTLAGMAGTATGLFFLIKAVIKDARQN